MERGKERALKAGNERWQEKMSSRTDVPRRCPFCGNEELGVGLSPGRSGEYAILCPCGATGPTVKAAYQAARRWNQNFKRRPAVFGVLGETTLLSCPWCGYEVVVLNSDWERNEWWVACTRCHGQGSVARSGPGGTREDGGAAGVALAAVAAWNREGGIVAEREGREAA